MIEECPDIRGLQVRHDAAHYRTPVLEIFVHVFP